MHSAPRIAPARAGWGGARGGVGARRHGVDVMGLRSPNHVPRVLASKFVGTTSFLRGRVGGRVLSPAREAVRCGEGAQNAGVLELRTATRASRGVRAKSK